MTEKPLPPNIKSLLAFYAESVRGQSNVPVLLRTVCEKLEIKVRREPGVPAGKAFLSWNRQVEKRPTILLPLRQHKTWDRFCAAHELGHFFLISEYGWIPADKDAYWQTEELCDYFARELLIPQKYLKDVTAASLKLLLRDCDALSEKSLVPWNQVARRISEASRNFFLVLEPSSRGGYRVTMSTLPNRQGTSIEIATEMLAPEVCSALEAARQTKKRVYIGGEPHSVVRGKLGELLEKKGTTKVVARVLASGSKLQIAATQS